MAACLTECLVVRGVPQLLQQAGEAVCSKGSAATSLLLACSLPILLTWPGPLRSSRHIPGMLCAAEQLPDAQPQQPWLQRQPG